MRTLKHGLSVLALALTFTFYAMPSSQADQKSGAVGSAKKAITGSHQNRSQLLLAGMVAAFASVLLLRRSSAESD